jgi:hypothetical protein
MIRLTFATLGTGLLVCWAIGFALHESPWMVWAVFVAGAFSWLVTLSVIFTDIHTRDVAPYAYGLAAALGLGFVGDLARRAPGWLAVTTLLFAIAYFGVGVAFSAGRRRTAS